MPEAPLPRKVLYIEDHNESKLLVARLLEAEGSQVISCSDGIQGLELALSTEPDFIFVDLNLPFMDGYETATRLKAAFLRNGKFGVPVVATSIYASHDEREMAIAAGCDGFIPKPVDVDTFVDTIRRYCDGARDVVSPDREKAALIQYHRRLVDKLEAKASTVFLDENTNFYNEQYLNLRLEEEASRALRLGQPFSIAVIAVEFLHTAAERDASHIKERTYRAMADIIRANKRAFDLGYKLNEEGFGLILLGCSREEALKAAERVSRRVLELLPNLLGHQLRVDLSVGVNTYVSGPMLSTDFVRIAADDVRPV